MLDDLSDSLADPLTTPFEDWCSAGGIHPESPGAWELYVGRAGARSSLAS
jgi:hypothetical protein